MSGRSIDVRVGEVGVERDGQDVLIGLDRSFTVIPKRNDGGVSRDAEGVFDAGGVGQDRLDGGDVVRHDGLVARVARYVDGPAGTASVA